MIPTELEESDKENLTNAQPQEILAPNKPTIRKSWVLLSVILVVILTAAGSSFIFYKRHKKDNSTAPQIFLSGITPPSYLKAPYSINDSVEMITAWVQPKQTSCTNMFATVFPSQQNRPNGITFKVQPNGTVNIPIDKGSNVVILIGNGDPTDPSNMSTCLLGYYLSSSNTPPVINDVSTAQAFASGLLINIKTANISYITSLKSYKSYSPVERYFTENLPTKLYSSLTELDNKGNLQAPLDQLNNALSTEMPGK